MERSFPQRDRVQGHAGPRVVWWVWEKPEAGTKTEWHSRTSVLFGRRAAPLGCFPLEAVLGCFPLSLVHDAEAGVASPSRCGWFPLCVRLHGPPVPDSPVWLDEAWCVCACPLLSSSLPARGLPPPHRRATFSPSRYIRHSLLHTIASA